MNHVPNASPSPVVSPLVSPHADSGVSPSASPGINTSVRLWQTDAPLTASSALMLGALVIAVAGLWLDPRTITGAPAWLKPAKFAISTAIYGVTLAWIFSYLPHWPRVRRVAGRTTAAMLVMEVVIIFVQAWRGTTSHFNIGTPLDGALFAIMGLGILAQTGAAVAVVVALWRQHFDDRVMGWALRLGLTISVLGSATGGLMTAPTTQQFAQVKETGAMPLSGAHTVGAPDGGPGLVGTGWSVDHGDLRVPHFFGLHAMQALPLVAFLLRRRVAEPTQVRLTMLAAAGYLSLFGLLLWQALRGESFVHPGAATTTALAAWGAILAVAVALTTMRSATGDARVHTVTF